jgi:colanic acid/amylovoran biosynthesis glycosyltransferase
MPLRVAYLVNQYPSVSHTFIRREIHALERQGVEVQRISVRGWDLKLVDESDCAERERTRYVLRRGTLGLAHALCRTAIRMPGRFWSAMRLTWLMSRSSDRPTIVHLAYLAEACLICQWLQASGVSHLHAHFATNPAQTAMLVHALGGPPYSFTAHGSDIADRPAQIGLSETVSRAAFVVAVCSFGRGQFFKWIASDDWSRVHVVRCGLEPGYGQAASGLAEGKPRFVCVGRLSKEKGQLLLIEAASQLIAGGIVADIVLAGDGPMRAEIEALIERHGIAARVRITGWLDAHGIQNELRLARALVVPSLSEGLPVVIMEAMASRLPVIAPYLAGIPELVTHGETGWLYPVGDVEALARAMRSCLGESTESLARMGEVARERVRAAHDIDVEAKKLISLFSAHD